MSTESHGGRGVERETSYGGVVVRGDAGAGGAEVIVITPTGKRVKGLPKGGPNDGESGAEAAAREVREETGVTVSVRGHLGDVRYWYRRGGRRVFKTVHFFLCDYISGDTADHDHEVDEASWMPLEEARIALSYPGEREMIERALSKLSRGR
jgi:8-oxo-dGTP pyrophosphatase MutT (NUDIX family)